MARHPSRLITGRWRVGLVSDLHCGSKYAITPPEWWPRGGRSVLPAARFMAHVWRCWEHFCRTCGQLDALIVNGDLIEGEASRRDALDAITDDLLVHQHCAEAALRLLRSQTRRLWIVRGTETHEGKYFECIEAAARAVGAEQWSPGRYTGYVLDARIGPLVLNATHHMTTGAIYRGTVADRTALFAQLAAALRKTVPADIIVRSHLHAYYRNDSHGVEVIMTPGWKLLSPYPIKRLELYRAAVSADVGGLVLEIEARPSGQTAVTVWKWLYDPYQPEIRALTIPARDVHARRAPRGRARRRHAGGRVLV